MKNVLLILATVLVLFSCTEEKVECVAVVNDDCVCTMDYTPVCGCNEITYSNKCQAECVGIIKYTEGACPAKNE